MILAWDNSWILYTPTKTGTYSLEGTLIDVLNVGVKIKPRHRMDIEMAPDKSQRLMIVRHPVERWCSIYWAIHRWTNSNSHPYMHQFIESPNIFADEYFRRIKDGELWPMYTNNNTQNAASCKPHHVFKTEELSKVLEHLGHSPELLKHLNHTKNRPSCLDTLAQLSVENQQALWEWALPDMESFSYEGTFGL